MQLLEWSVPESFELILAGDMHQGTKLRDEAGIDKMISYVMAAPNRYLVFMGDALEAIVPDDRRYDLAVQDGNSPLLQAVDVVERFKPLAEDKRIVTWLMGNHEYKLRNYGDITKNNICDPLGVQYGTYTAKVDFKDKAGRTMFKGFFYHGSRSLDAKGDDPQDVEHRLLRKLKMMLKDLASDCLLMAVGHNHKLLVRKPSNNLTLVSDGKRFHQHYMTDRDYASHSVYHPDYRWYVSTGSFLKLYENGYTNYAEIAGYNPIELGYIVVEVSSGTITNIRKEFV